MYEVNVQLNESDARTYINGAKEMTTVFAAENQRDYEEFEV